MLKQNLTLLSLLTITTTAHPEALSFEKNWQNMQSNYIQLSDAMTHDQQKKMNSELCHSYWNQQKQAIKKLILGPSNKQFLRHPVIAHNMVRREMGDAQKYELNYLQNSTKPEVKNKLKQFKEETFSGLSKECLEFNCGANTLGHLYYTAKVLENLKNQHNPVIVEFGGGYGNLGRIFKTLIPNSTVIIVDLPEFTVLQDLFLKSTLDNTEVIIHHTQPQEYKTGAIHLIPTFLIENMALKADVFISNFGLSETTQSTQKIMSDKKFFDADVCYISGQIEGWNMFESHNTIYQGIKNNYPTIHEKPFHIYSAQHKSYEIIGVNN